MFLQVSVILFTGGGAWSRGVPGGDPPPTMATAAGGMHPTGMHSCFHLTLVNMISSISYDSKLFVEHLHMQHVYCKAMKISRVLKFLDYLCSENSFC